MTAAPGENPGWLKNIEKLFRPGNFFAKVKRRKTIANRPSKARKLHKIPNSEKSCQTYGRLGDCASFVLASCRESSDKSFGIGWFRTKNAKSAN
jgi:hypothetical protein